MEDFLNKYIKFGSELQSTYKVMSNIKKGVFGLFILVILIQLFILFNNGFYPRINSELWLRVISLLYNLPLMAILFYTICYVKKFKYKNLKKIIGVFVAASIITLIVLFICSYSPFFPKELIIFIIAFLINILISLFIHIIPFHLINYKFLKFKPESNFKKFEVDSDEGNSLKEFLLLISPDYFFSNLYKSILTSDSYRLNEIDKNDFITLKGKSYTTLTEEKNRLRYFIVFSNWFNLMIVIYVITILMFINLDSVSSSDIKVFLLYLIILRIVSRVFEVVYAFFKDVVRKKVLYFHKLAEGGSITKSKFYDNWRNSSIRKPERISLAVHSYIEIILLFSILYSLIIGFTLNNSCELVGFKTIEIEVVKGQMAESQPICDNKGNILQLEKNQKADVEIESDSLIEIILYSASVTFFNFSFDYSNSTPTAWKIAHVTQVMTSIVLIVLSLASYLSFKDVMDEDEVKEFLLIKYWEKRSKGEYKEFLERVESRSVDEIPEK